MSGWDDAENAALYEAFVRKHPLYTQTSRHLIGLARLPDAGIVVDLACGTGATTRVILGHLRESARVIALDASGAMLQRAKASLPDARVAWVQADSSEIAAHAAGVDAIVCNSAFWLTDMPSTLRSCAAALRAGGRLAFNVPREFVHTNAPGGDPPSKPTLMQLARAVAVADYGMARPGRDAGRGSPARQAQPSMKDMIASAGLVLEAAVPKEFPNTAESDLDWCCIPFFSDIALPGLPRAKQLEVIRSAYAQRDKYVVRRNRWVTFVARK